MFMPRPALSILLTIVLSTPALAQLTVSAATPANNARGISPAGLVTVTFNTPIDPTTINQQNIKLAGRWSGPVPGQLSIGGGGTTVTFQPLRPLFATEIATLTVSRFVTSTLGAPLTGGFTSTWWIDSAPSTGSYQLAQVVDYRLPGEGTVRTYGFFAGDVDGDGSPDMSATNEVSWDVRLLKNDGCGNFGAPTITAMPNGEEPSPNEGADFNGDGRIDLATGNQNGQSVSVFLNSGAGSYLPPLMIPVGGPVHGLALLDVDSDGDVDIAATNQQNIALIRNNGNGTFALPTFFDGGGSGEWSIQAGNANGDGKADLFCGTQTSLRITVLLGNGSGAFSVAGFVNSGGFPWQMALGDMNSDGKLDCVIANRSNSTAVVFLGNGLGGLAAGVGYAVGNGPVSVDIGDLEGDDDLDIVTANFFGGNATMLRNNGAGVFGNATALPAGSAGSCGVIVDYDRDGDTDVIVVDELDDKAFVWRQVGPGNQLAQNPTCDAALRINSFANRGGYAGAPAHLLPGGRLAFFGISGGTNQVLALYLGAKFEPGLLSPFGTIGLDLNQSTEVWFSGFGGDPSGVLDGSGERTLPIAVPFGLPPGTTLALQCLLSTPTGLAVSNPEELTF